jgi:ABC-type tungstate transport system substrate-binding protein
MHDTLFTHYYYYWTTFEHTIHRSLIFIKASTQFNPLKGLVVYCISSSSPVLAHHLLATFNSLKMTYFIICILIILCYSSSAFQVIPAKSFAAHNRPYSSLQRQHLSTTEMNSAMATPIKNADNRTREEKWLDYVQSEDVMVSMTRKHMSFLF